LGIKNFFHREKFVIFLEKIDFKKPQNQQQFIWGFYVVFLTHEFTAGKVFAV
jgi:hypothetical protein